VQPAQEWRDRQPLRTAIALLCFCPEEVTVVMANHDEVVTVRVHFAKLHLTQSFTLTDSLGVNQGCLLWQIREARIRRLPHSYRAFPRVWSNQCGQHCHRRVEKYFVGMM
jgi:hypothetical protein